MGTENTLKQLAGTLHCTIGEVPAAIAKLKEQAAGLTEQLTGLQRAGPPTFTVQQIGSIRLITGVIPGADAGTLAAMADHIIKGE